jgi:hypothetical protein
MVLIFSIRWASERDVQSMCLTLLAVIEWSEKKNMLKKKQQTLSKRS